LSSLLVRWESAEEAGQSLTPEQLCAGRPDLAGALAEAIEALRQIKRLMPAAGDGSATLGPEVKASALLVRWEQAQQQGQELTTEDLCPGRPDLHEPLRRAAALLSRMRQTGASDETRVSGPEDAPPAAPAPIRAATPPGYEILGELGRGGMGVVYKARQVQAGRVVALKMILSGSHASEEEVARFRTEAEAVARLRHLGVVAVYEVGEHDGRAFFSLEYCEGGGLDKKLNGTPLPAEEAARLVRSLAHAVQAAHAHAVVHRDLKPANVLLTADGTPKVTDFGLAKKLDEQGKTQTGAVMGTPSYMAPEQARGDRAGPAADVYSLGAILYECLTGRPPFKGATVMQTLQMVESQEAAPARRLNPSVPLDLETIAAKCLSKEPQRRYASAQELADDLGRFLDGSPVRARPVGPLERAAKWARRRPAVAGLAFGLVAVVLASLGGLIALWQAAVGQRDAAKQAQAKAQEAQAKAQEERDHALANLREAHEQRERAHFYLESFLDMGRFGRDLSVQPLRRDFDVRLKVIQGDESWRELQRGEIAAGHFDRGRPFSLSIESNEDCFVTVFYAVPESAKDLTGLAKYLLVFPNQTEEDNRVKGESKRIVLNDRRTFLAPYVVAKGEVAYLYLLASTQDWALPAGRKVRGGFYGFTPDAARELSRRITALVEGRRSGHAEGANRIAEDVYVFNVHKGAKDR
jgi:tRNA A-37 threonylcarbamoyl transferase component Bud32